MLDSSSQTEQVAIINKQQIYDKISDYKRASLIHTLQSKKCTLKEVATSLNINYSTAKTIIQTFRKEKRTIKRPKFNITSKRAEKRMHKLTKSLISKPIALIISEINDSETISTTEQNNNGDKAFHKVISANSLDIAELRNELFGTILQNKEVQTDSIGRPVFGLIRNNELCHDIDYSDGLLLKKRGKWLPSIDSYLSFSSQPKLSDEEKLVFRESASSGVYFTPILRNFYSRKKDQVINGIN